MHVHSPRILSELLIPVERERKGRYNIRVAVFFYRQYLAYPTFWFLGVQLNLAPTVCPSILVLFYFIHNKKDKM